MRVDPKGTIGARLRWAMAEFAGDLRPGHDPWVLHPFPPSGGAPRIQVTGAIYVAISRGEVAYVGQTIQQVQHRLGQHIESPVKRAAFTSVLVIALVTGADLDRAERITADMLGPFLGSRWPARKTA
jgi:hypothetical protein